MYKQSVLKKCTSSIIALTILVTCFCFNVFAANDSKTVTQTIYGSVTVPDSQIAATLGFPNAPSTQYYNDGQYKGTLYLQSKSMYDVPRNVPGTNLYVIKYAWVYSGTVALIIVEKAVTVTDYKTVTVPDSQIAATIGNPNAPLTKFYDDGQYRGTLNLKSTSMYDAPQNVPGTNLFKLKFSLVYTGTVQKYK